MNKRFEKFLCTEGGVTKTSAAHMCAISNEEAKKIITLITLLSFTNEFIQLPGSEKMQSKVGASDISNLEALHARLAQLHAFNAWFRRAVDSHEENINEIKELQFSTWMELNGITLPTLPVRPTGFSEISEDQVLEELEIGEYLKYIIAEATASTYGKQIHEGRPLSDARQALINALSEPIKCERKGTDTIITSSEPSIGLEQVDDLFYKLQGLQRTADKQKNSVLAKVKTTRDQLNNEARAKFEVEMAEYDAQEKAYQAARRKAIRDCEAWRAEALQKAAKKHIVVPACFQDLWNELSSLEAAK